MKTRVVERFNSRGNKYYEIQAIYADCGDVYQYLNEADSIDIAKKIADSYAVDEVIYSAGE